MWVHNAGPQWTKRPLLTGDFISGSMAAEVGLVFEPVPADQLDDHVTALATRIAAIGKGLLADNKPIVNLGVELMGRRQLQVLAGIHDALGHLRLRNEGVREAVAEPDAAFQ